MRVKRSTTCRFRDAWPSAGVSRKLVVSTTSVSPSQWPTESPSQLRISGGACSWFIRMMRASWTISTWTITVSSVCTIRFRLL